MRLFELFTNATVNCFPITYVRIVNVPWTVKVTFITRNTKTSKIEGEGGRPIVKRILSCLEGTVFRVCESFILSRLFKLVSYVSRRNVSLGYIVCSWICTGQVKTTLKLPSMNKFPKFWHDLNKKRTNRAFLNKHQSGKPVVHIKTTWKHYGTGWQCCS